MGALRRTFANGTRVVRRVALGRVFAADSGNWIVLDIEGDLAERSHIGFGRPSTLGLLDTLRCIEAAGDDHRVDGVLLRLRGNIGRFSHALSLRRALGELRAKGKRVAVFAESMAAFPYLVATAADRIWMPESGNLFLVGLRTERYYLRDVLDRIGAKPEVVHVGKFKSAGETFTRDSMSDEEREQVESWQADVWEDLVTGIALGRSLEPSTVRDLIDTGPYSAAAAVETGLVDALVYADEIEKRLEPLARAPRPGARGPRRVHLLPAVDYFLAHVMDPGFVPIFRDRPALVYLLAEGGVRSGEGFRGITSGGMGGLLAALREDPRVRGVALRIDSGGGDALASDLIHRRVEQLGREKPVVVSMGEVVASGGYYIAAAADQVFAESGTVTGSIGVVGGKINLAGVYERLGISKEGVQQGARAGMLSEARGFNSDERAAVRREMQAIYGTFLDRVAKGRSKSREDVEKIAQGRIWSGRRAQALGLVDALGGPLEALRDLATRAGLQPHERYTLALLPRVPRLPEWAGMLFGTTGSWKAGRGMLR
ncbi:MAG: signal peptide peptidase SppA [Deltaproteobacteria bacterium]|nr:signal peptide peptidase SppA [Deltaproteobacteria bacterium]MBW2382085.1 signal peptide peptidase SppA [Deltaproteobacteria bacterium]MBW2695707.1 signal peptide peptidase SppA [Deltaproteobacteria bacterium]